MTIFPVEPVLASCPLKVISKDNPSNGRKIHGSEKNWRFLTEIAVSFISEVIRERPMER